VASSNSFELEKIISKYEKEIKSLTDVSVALSREKDRDKLLAEILTRIRSVTHSDGGALFVVIEDPEKKDSQKPFHSLASKCLEFKIVQNDTLPEIEKDFKEMTLNINEKSLVGYCALYQEVINIRDVYHIDPEAPYSFDKSWDQRNNYRTTSILAVPMIGTTGETVGVIELINRKQETDSKLDSIFNTGMSVRFYDKGMETFALALASQAAIALENVNLYSSIENLFEGFIAASVRAIEARDPTTSGHSFRVAELTVGLAKATSDVSVGSYQNLQMTEKALKEIKYASLLHDFGKLSIPSQVLVKAKKLYPHDLDFLRQRISWLRAEVRLLASEKKIQCLEEGRSYENIEQELLEALAELDHFEALVKKSNEPTILEEGDFKELETFKARQLATQEEEIAFLTDFEFTALSLKKGTLIHEERRQIESHVSHTFEFLRTIPWTQDLESVPNIAYSHHEKLSGKGYPRGLPAEKIPVQARMMTIADIFDALTARDRPYKRALSVEKSLDILQSEVDRGDLDAELFRIFLDRKIYQIIQHSKD
jgi:HD-GYP domain-containing protein (c-di-GMP phosphodiesterase class II)